MTRNKYNPIPRCDDKLCPNPPTKTRHVYFVTSSGNHVKRIIRLCPKCAALMDETEGSPLPHGIPTPYLSQLRGSRYA